MRTVWSSKLVFGAFISVCDADGNAANYLVVYSSCPLTEKKLFFFSVGSGPVAAYTGASISPLKEIAIHQNCRMC
jgi:hypothetical protein